MRCTVRDPVRCRRPTPLHTRHVTGFAGFGLRLLPGFGLLPPFMTMRLPWQRQQRPNGFTHSDSSHVVMLSNPGLVLDVIRTAANAVQGT